MELTILTVPECPHAPLLDDRLAQVLDGVPHEALEGRTDVVVTRRVITDEREAARCGMRAGRAAMTGEHATNTRPEAAADERRHRIAGNSCHRRSVSTACLDRLY
jgi:hypothetical protein